jgi:2-C-methyl-D-erythritol 4-phosphate cytidylyltransferase
MPVTETLRRLGPKAHRWGQCGARFALAQTPQGFRREVLERALQWARDLVRSTDEAELVERLGQR